MTEKAEDALRKVLQERLDHLLAFKPMAEELVEHLRGRLAEIEEKKS